MRGKRISARTDDAFVSLSRCAWAESNPSWTFGSPFQASLRDAADVCRAFPALKAPGYFQHPADAKLRRAFAVEQGRRDACPHSRPGGRRYDADGAEAARVSGVEILVRGLPDDGWGDACSILMG